MPLVHPPSLEKHQAVSSLGVQADLDCLSFPPISDEEFLQQMREIHESKIRPIVGNELPILDLPEGSSESLAPPLCYYPPVAWVTRHFNQGHLQNYLMDLQTEAVSKGGIAYFSKSMIEKGKKGFETFIEGGT